MKIIFLGTPEFAVPSLKGLIDAGYDIVAVVTAPDKPSGRGLQIQESAVKKFAIAHGVKVLQPAKLKDPLFLEELKRLEADLQIVIAFRMLPVEVWTMPPLGTLNLHASMLPKYRGAAPINRAIMNGETSTGLTTFFLKHEIDTGSIIMQEPITISPTASAGELHDLMMQKGADLVLNTVKIIEKGNYHLLEQDYHEDLPHAPKIFKEDCLINWNQSIDQVYNHIRGLSPSPAAYTLLNGEVFKVYKAEKIQTTHSEMPGSFKIEGKDVLYFAANNGYIKVLEVQAAGKKKMTIKDFMSGFRPHS
jgi:methionyl-tRNA formyltransferase